MNAARQTSGAEARNVIIRLPASAETIDEITAKLEGALVRRKAKTPLISDDQRKCLIDQCREILVTTSLSELTALLRPIRDQTLYQAVAGNFDEFCETLLQSSGDAINRLLDAPGKDDEAIGLTEEKVPVTDKAGVSPTSSATEQQCDPMKADEVARDSTQAENTNPKMKCMACAGKAPRLRSGNWREKFTARIRNTHSGPPAAAPTSQAVGPASTSPLDPAGSDTVQVIRAIPLPEALEDFTRDIKQLVIQQHNRFILDAIAIGAAFLAATEKYGQTLRELADKAVLDYSTVTRYVSVTQRFGPEDQSWARAQLPASVDSVMRLAQLKPHEFEDAAKNGKIHPGMGRKEVKELLREYRPAIPKGSPEPGTAERVENPVGLILEPVPSVTQQSAQTPTTPAKSSAELADEKKVEKTAIDAMDWVERFIKKRQLRIRHVAPFWEQMEKRAGWKKKGNLAV